MTSARPLAVAFALALLVTPFLIAPGCGGGGGGGAAGSGGTGGTGAPGGGSGSGDGPCSLETRIGRFAVQLRALEGSTPYTSIEGGVYNGVDPRNVWQAKGAAAGGCKLMVGPMLVCTTSPCTSPQICAGQNQCVDEPRLQNLGTVTVSGVGPAPITIDPLGNNYSKSLTDPYPPFSSGAAVQLTAAGAAIPAFTLESGGIEPLVFSGSGLVMNNGQALAVTWTPPAAAGVSRIFMKAEIGHHGGVAAAIECDLPDTGSGEIPAALVTALIAEGVHGFPTLSLTRRAISSKTVGAGCVEFSVASPVERSIGVCPTPQSCIVSCDRGDPNAVCPTGTTCQTDYTCR